MLIINKLQSSIIHQIRMNKNFINLIQNGQVLENSNEYFYYAFSPKKIENRNDLLILGLYKMVYKSLYDGKKIINFLQFHIIKRRDDKTLWISTNGSLENQNC